MAASSSDVCDWMPLTCCACNKKIRKSIDSFMAYMDDVTGEAWTKCASCLKSNVTSHAA